MSFRCLVAAAAFAFLPATTNAAIGPACGTCQGSVYELTYSGVPIKSTSTTQTFQFTLTIQASGYSEGPAFVESVALKVSDRVSAVHLASAPAPVAQWKASWPGTKTCDLGQDGFVCAVNSPPAEAPVPGVVTYSWVFEVTIPTKAHLFTASNAARIKVRYTGAKGNRVGKLVSERITLGVSP
jgi:hypothetical protein